MPSTVLVQLWALIRRYTISLYRRPILNLIRLMLWPAFLIGLVIFLLHKLANIPDEYKKIFSLVGYIEPAIYIILSLQFNHFTEWLVADRATGMKSLLISMGLKRSSYYLGNSVCFLVLTLPPVMIIATISLVYILNESQTSSVAILLVFLLFTIHLLAALFVFASIITSSTFIGLVTILLILEPLVHSAILWIMEKASTPLQPMVLFVGSISPFESIRILCDSYRLCKNCGATTIENNLVSQPTYLILIAMTFWTMVAFALARWFEEVCPWQKDSAVRNFSFCFESEGDYNQAFENTQDEPKESKFFEQTLSTREVGIGIYNLTKIFREIPVVNNVNFNIFKGETTLLIGPNGAGKTTLMDMVLGKLNPDEGKVVLRNSDGTISRGREGVGVCPQTSILDDSLTVKQHLELFAAIKTPHMTGSELRDHIKTTVADCGLTSHIHKIPSELSGGMKRKLSLALAFVGNSGTLILDEPSSGLDPDSRVSVWDAIRRYRADRTVLLSTQHMEEADYLGDRIAIMSEGRIICCGSSIFLKNIFGNGYKLRVECHASKKEQVLTFVRKHFATAEPSESIQLVTPGAVSHSENDPVQDIVFGLTDDKTKDLEMNLIRMLEEIENNASALHIRAHGLKSSSIEDVLLNTSKAFEHQEPNKAHEAVQPNSTSGHIATLAEPLRTLDTGFISSQRLLLNALLMKHIHSYRKNWFSILIYRILVPTFVIWKIIENLPYMVDYSPSFMLTLLVFHYVFNPTFERLTKFKTVQLTSNANFVVYWLSQLLIDLLSIIILAINFNLFLSFTFGGTILGSKFTVHLILTIGVILMGVSAAMIAYILSFIMNDTKTCVGFSLFLYSIGSIMSLLVRIAQIATSTDLRWLSPYVNSSFIAISPLASFQYIQYGLHTECYIGSSTSTTECNPSSFSPITEGFVFLCAQILVYTGILYFIEKKNLDFSWRMRWKNIFCRKSNPFASEMQETDADVRDENSKVTQLVYEPVLRKKHSLIAWDLNKSYPSGVKAVDQLSFTVERGECFGLLGVNGAGKSTTFSMLVAESKPNSGKIWINGSYDTSDLTTYRQNLGYDPQSNPEMSLSPTDALYLMARLRKVNEASIAKMVHSILELLAMSEHAHKPAKDLSGGTKRKLALGMSLIGSPALLALDEPTAGVDPITRRSIWHLLRSLRMQNGASIVISSHAMEECEAICDRISIMARGKLRCIGTFLSLRSKFSQGCSIRIHFSGQLMEQRAVGEAAKIISLVSQCLQTELSAAVKLSDTNINSATFNVSDDNVKRSRLFKILRDLRQKHPEMSYMVNDSSLEDIFMALAREQQEFEQANLISVA